MSALASAKDLDGWIVFSARHAYTGRRTKHVEQLRADDVLAFMRERRDALPPIVDTWVQQALSGQC